jgi:hypothetical protein
MAFRGKRSAAGRIAILVARDSAAVVTQWMPRDTAEFRRLVADATAGEFVGVTRQNMRKLMVNHAKTFPAPIHEGSAALWHLAPVLEWLRTRGVYAIEQRLLEISHIAMQINVVKEAYRVETPVENRIRALVA